MKKAIGIALVLALASVLCFSTVALAGDPQGVQTTWNFDGEGSIQIDTYKNLTNVGEDHLSVNTLGSGSSGWQNINVIPAPTSGSYTWSGSRLQLDRQVLVENGSVSTFMVRDNSAWAAYTEYGAYLDVGSSGTLEQHFSNSYFAATMNTNLSANGLYDMTAWAEGTNGGYFFFGLGADGDGSGVLGLSTTDYANHGGCRYLNGGFFADTTSNAGLVASWDNLAKFAGQVETPDITMPFAVNVTGSGGDNPFDPDDPDPGFSTGASADWVTISGYIGTPGVNYSGMR